MAESELGSALELMDEAGYLLMLLNPNCLTLRYYRGDLNEPELREAFIDEFWDQARGDWHGKPGSLVMTFCLAQYYLSLKKAIGNIVLPRIGIVDFIEVDNDTVFAPTEGQMDFLFRGGPMVGSSSWITYWQQGVSGLLGGREGEQHGTMMNDELALRFFLKVDPRLIANSESQDCSMSPLIQKAIDAVIHRWKAQWSYKSVEYGEVLITITNLLTSVIGKKSHDVFETFGVKSNDRESGRQLIHGLASDEPVMEQLLHKQLVDMVSLALLTQQIERALKT